MAPPSRRAALALIAATLASPAWAAPDPAGFIRDMQAELARVAPQGKPADSVAVERVVTRAFDMDAIARAVLGSRAAQATPAQLRRLAKVYVKRVVRETLERRRTAKGTTRITGTKPAGAGEWVVTTTSQRTQGDPVILGWRVRNGAAGLRIVDVLRDGTSLVATQRRDIQTALRAKSLDDVIAGLEQKYAKPVA